MTVSLPFANRVPLDAAERQALLSFACSAISSAGRQALPFFRSSMVVSNKDQGAGFDPVTEADRAVEEDLRNAIAQAFPEHGILGEEYGLTGGNGLTWVIDPIDGTRAFMSGLLHWGVLLGLFDGQRAVLGALYQPVTDELFWGDGAAAWYRRGAEPAMALQVQASDSLKESIVATSWSGFFERTERQAGFSSLALGARLMHLQGDCYLYGLLAMGQLQVVLDGGLSPYDILPLIPIIQGAGGVVVGGDGNDPQTGGFIVAAASQSLADAALDTVNHQRS
ncbi:MAG: inositol monophosphatase family protein [Pseudomonadota bacterium]